MLTCDKCQAKLTERVHRNFRDKMLGLDSVTLDGIKTAHCVKHGQRSVTIPAMGPMLDAIGVALIAGGRTLTKAEHAWLRSLLNGRIGRGARTLNLKMRYDEKSNGWVVV